MKYINGGILTTREDVQKIYLPRMVSYTNTEKGWGLWKVSLKSQQFIGWVLVRPMDFFTDNPQFSNLELGWRFAQKWWGNGYATEAAKAIMEALVNSKNATFISALALQDNLASIRIMEKIGLRYLKTDLHKDPLGDHSAVFYQLEIYTR